MAMVVGTAAIAVAGDGTISVTGSGMAKAIADGMAASGGSVFVNVANTMANITDPVMRAAILPGIGPFFSLLAQDVALGVVNHLTANAKAVITTAMSAGRMPSSTTPGTPISPPGTNLDLGIQ